MKSITSMLPALEGGQKQRKEFLVFGAPNIQKPEINEVLDSLRSNWIGTGPKVIKFESSVKNYLKARHVIALNSCTAGLHLSLLAAGIKQGDEVITTTMTFAATANVIEHVGARPIFVDVEKSTMNINPSEINKNITKKTKAVILVHMAGRPCKMDEIAKIAKRHKLIVIEDAAHAFGAEYKGKKIGTISDLTVFSFYVTKNLTTGEGGMITTKDEKYADFIKIHALHGMSHDAWKRYGDTTFKHYLIKAAGFKYNMMDIQAAIGIHQLKRFEENQLRRKEIWKIYNKAFSDLPIITPFAPEPSTKHAYHLYTILVNLDELKVDRDTILRAIRAENIGVGVHFIALHLHPFYKNKYNFKRGDFPNAEYISDRTISIPFSHALSNKDVRDVIAAVRKVILHYSKRGK